MRLAPAGHMRESEAEASEHESGRGSSTRRARGRSGRDRASAATFVRIAGPSARWDARRTGRGAIVLSDLRRDPASMPPPPLSVRATIASDELASTRSRVPLVVRLAECTPAIRPADVRGSSTSSTQDFHTISTGTAFRAGNRVNPPSSTYRPGARTTVEIANSTLDRSLPRSLPFQDRASSVRTRAHRAHMIAPLAPQSSLAAAAHAAQSSIAVLEDPFPERRGLAEHDLGRVLDRALFRRARNALPCTVRPPTDPLPPSTEVRSRDASWTRDAVSPRAGRGLVAPREKSRCRSITSSSSESSASAECSSTANAPHESSAPNALTCRAVARHADEPSSRPRSHATRASLCRLHSHSSRVHRSLTRSAHRSPSGRRSMTDVSTSGRVRRRAPRAGH
jgi:hypothetical protein